jgi:hypothetical protein
MKYSKLKHEIELLELRHKHETEVMKLKHATELSELKEKCNHTFEDGTSARQFTGTQWDSHYTCEICGKTIG